MRLLHRMQSGNRQPAEPFDTPLRTPRLIGRPDGGLLCHTKPPKVWTLREGDSGDGARTSKMADSATTQYVLDLAATLPVVFSDDEAHPSEHGTTLPIRRY